MFATTLFMRTEWGKNNIQLLTFSWLLLPQLMITWMIAVTEGATSIYYAGLTIAVFGSATALPFSLWQNFALGVTTYLLYVAACAFHPETVALHGPFVVNSFLLLFTAIASAVSAYFNEHGRILLFRLKNEVAEKNFQLEQTNRNLAQIKGQMLQQDKMAAIGTLASGLLHEVNNPVNYALMAVSLAQEEHAAKASPTLSECLSDAHEGLQRIHHIVTDLKTFAYRPREAEANMNAFPLERAIDSALRLVVHETKAVTITRNLPEDTLVHGDEGAIIGVLINLLGNSAMALQSANSDQATIKISAYWQDERLRVTVEDNGPGIPADDIGQVFDPFYTTREVGKGLGLGLSISYTVIQRHGGTLTAESSPGEWTRMSFDLPRPN